MNSTQLLANFNRMSEAPDAIPRLRRFILDLAVRGKLVEQDPKDEPASELLKRIQAEKARLEKEGKIRKQPLLQPAVDEVNAPFLAPKHWAWLQLDEIGILSGGMTPSKNRSEFWDGNINWFSPKDIKSDEIVDSELKITAAGIAETGLQLYPPGCLFMVARSGILKRTFPVSINRVDASANQDLKVLTPFVKGLERYLQIMFRGMTTFILSALVKTGTTVQSLKYEEFKSQPFPLPPLAEQHRIVAKVDELMTMCDRLEAAQAERESRRDRLVASSLHRMNNGADVESFREYTRFHLRHLPRLTTRREHIQQLRQSILSLAVRGKLVPQDPNDEPASELLKRIQAEKEKLTPRRKEAKDQLPPVEANEMPFEIPPGWAWARLIDVSAKIHYGYTASAIPITDGVRLLRITDIQNNRVNWSSVPGCEITTNQAEQYLLAIGDILIARTGGTIGKSFLVEEVSVKAVFASYLIRVQRLTGMYDRYLKLFLESPVYWKQLDDGARGGGQPNVNGQTLGKMTVTIPPLNEQKRIVAKVTELTAQCDQLEAHLTTTQTDSRRLLEATLYEALGKAA